MYGPDLKLNFTHNIQPSEYKSFRDQLIKEAVAHINQLRKGTKFESKVETPAKLAKRINMNPFLLRDGELLNILNDCKKKNSYAKLYWALKNPTVDN
jgi:hypothetical protein